MIKIKIKITITRSPSKIGIYIRERFKCYYSYIRLNIIAKIKKLLGKLKMTTKNKLKLFMKENDI